MPSQQPPYAFDPSASAGETDATPRDPAAGAYVRFYEFLVGHTDELPHMLRLAREATDGAARILECGTGTGRLGVPLAQAGHRVVGLDRSPSMLARAKQRWQTAAPPDPHAYQLVEADFAAPPAETVEPNSFDLVIYSSNTLALVTDEMRQHAALQAAFAALRPGGLLMLEQFHPAGFFNEAFRQREWYHQFTRVNPDTGLQTSRNISFLHDPVEQHVWGTTLVEEFLPQAEGGGSRRHMFVEHVRYHHVAELRLRLRSVGFKRRDVVFYGGHEREGLTPRSLKLVAIARKA